MVVFGMVLAALVGLAVLADRASAMLRRGGTDGLLRRCTACDLSYPHTELLEDGAACPRGHRLEDWRPQPQLGTVALVAASVFVLVGLTLYWAGLLKAP